MANNRIFYACQAVAIAPCFTAHTTNNTRFVHGVQSVGVTTNFNLEQAFELGQIQIYENIEGLPEVEVTLERVLDGYPLAYHIASSDASSAGLVGRSKARSCVGLGIYEDSYDAVSGAAPVEVYMSGMYLSSLRYSLPTDGNCTESVTLVGNFKTWNLGANSKLLTSGVIKQLPTGALGIGTDSPAALVAGSGGIQRRENVNMSGSILPKSIYGVLQTANTGNAVSNGVPLVHVQSVNISTDFSRDNILELGRKAPYYRAAKFPIEVTSEFEVIALSGDFVSAYESGDPANAGTTKAGNNTSEERILIVLDDSTTFDLGSKNRLSSVTYGGGDAAGGNATIKYSYSTFNDLLVLQNLDPAKGVTVTYSLPVTS